MGGLIRNSVTLLSVSHVQHCIVMATRLVPFIFEALIFVGELVKSVTILLLVNKIHTRLLNTDAMNVNS